MIFRKFLFKKFNDKRFLGVLGQIKDKILDYLLESSFLYCLGMAFNNNIHRIGEMLLILVLNKIGH